MLRIVSPLIAKVLIQELVRAKAYSDAARSGSSLDDLTAPMSLGQLAGVAVGLLAVLTANSILLQHGRPRAEQIGMHIRGAVSLSVSHVLLSMLTYSGHRSHPAKDNVSPTFSR